MEGSVVSNEVRNQNESSNDNSVRNEKKTVNRELDLSDLDSISGGVEVVAPAHTEDLVPTTVNQRCNCGKFTPHTPGLNLDICDNCKHALKTAANSDTTYCSKQKFSDVSAQPSVPQPIVIS